MRSWHWLTLASALLFPLEAHAIPIDRIVDINILQINDTDDDPVCGIDLEDLPSCGSGNIHFVGPSRWRLNSYDFSSDDFPQFDSSGFGHDELPFANPLFTGKHYLNPTLLPDYAASHPGSNPLSAFVLTEGKSYALIVSSGPGDYWVDSVTTDFQPGSFGVWSTSEFISDEIGDGFTAFYQVQGVAPVPEPGSLLLLLSAFGLWFGFRLTRPRRSIRQS